MNSNFTRYFLYSISFHALALILLLLFGQKMDFEPPPQTQVTMIRLIRGQSDSGQLLQRPSPGTPSAPPPSTPVQPVPPAPQPVVQKTPPPPQAVVKPAVKPQTQTKPETGVRLPDKNKPPTAKPPPVKPQTPPTPQAPSAEEQKMAQALSQVGEELKQRENQSSAGASPGEAPGTSTGPAFGSPSGEVNAQDAELAQYRSQVRSKIIREWVRTAVGANGETLRARILVRINASGAVISRSFAKQSGDAAFDNSALRAVERASPLPPPPAGAQAEALNEGFIIDFSSRMLGR